MGRGDNPALQPNGRGQVDGPGFSPDLADHAFERFTRGDTARTREAGSSAGLGLALVQAIVAAHGGTVSLTSRPGDTLLRIDLPA